MESFQPGSPDCNPSTSEILRIRVSYQSTKLLFVGGYSAGLPIYLHVTAIIYTINVCGRYPVVLTVLLNVFIN